MEQNEEKPLLAELTDKLHKSSNGNLTLSVIGLISKAIIVLAVVLFIAGFAMYAGLNDISGVSLMCIAPALLILYPFMRGLEIVVRAAVRYLQINGEPDGK
jgi:hypothetical protein